MVLILDTHPDVSGAVFWAQSCRVLWPDPAKLLSACFNVRYVSGPITVRRAVHMLEVKHVLKCIAGSGQNAQHLARLSPLGIPNSLGVQERTDLLNQDQLSAVVCISCLPYTCGMWQ